MPSEIDVKAHKYGPKQAIGAYGIAHAPRLCYCIGMTGKVRGRKRGRRPMPPSDKQSQVVRVLLRPDQLDRIKELAGAKPLSAYLRERGLAS